MTFALPKVRVGEPVVRRGVAVFPLSAEESEWVDYLLSEEALANESVVVEEVDEGGSVPDLLVSNQGTERVLFLEGEELIGAKQNRVLNTSVLVAPKTRVKIPVSCVEQGRWRYASRSLESHGTQSPSKLRKILKASVHKSLKEERGHTSDQGKVWEEVFSLNDSFGVESDSCALYDAHLSFQVPMREYCDEFEYAQGAVGAAVAVGNRIASIDVFDKPSSCAKIWGRLVQSVYFEAREADESDSTVTIGDVEQCLQNSHGLVWSRNDAVGEGDEYRAESEEGRHGSALKLGDTIVHGSLLP